MDDFFERLVASAATIDELLSEAFDSLPGQKRDTELATQRLAAWCRSCASGDWSLFSQRLERDGLSFAKVLARFATVRRNSSAPMPSWIADAIWVEAALQNPIFKSAAEAPTLDSIAFEELFVSVAQKAHAHLEMNISKDIYCDISQSVHAELHLTLVRQLSDLFAEVLYEKFSEVRDCRGLKMAGNELSDNKAYQYEDFIKNMRRCGFRDLFREKPVLLRLAATLTRQWIDTNSEFLIRLAADKPIIYKEILQTDIYVNVIGIKKALSDQHNGGQSVLIVCFEDGSRVIYKPKDLRLDVAWYALLTRLNSRGPPVDLKASRAIARDGYGWAEFIDHCGCDDEGGCRRFFERAGAWLALFHLFVGSDMHEENIIASGEYPVPIDLEMLLQPTASEDQTEYPEAQAFEAAVKIIDNSVMFVGLLPIYRTSSVGQTLAIGGVTADWKEGIDLSWAYINSDSMRPEQLEHSDSVATNLPNVNGHYAKFVDHIDDFVKGFEEFSNFIVTRTNSSDWSKFLDECVHLPVRKIIRPTSFYYHLLQRLRNHDSMHDGASWSAQADFLARLSDWEAVYDPIWPLQRAERAALTALDVPYFNSLSNGRKIHDRSGVYTETLATSGIDRANDRVRSFANADIIFQTKVIRHNTAAMLRIEHKSRNAEKKRLLFEDRRVAPNEETWIKEANRIADDITTYAIRRGAAAAWISLDWLDSEIAQLAPVGTDVYNGVSGIAIFLAGHAKVTGNNASGDLALSAIAHLRKVIKGRNAARTARSLGTGGVTGLGSIVYAFAVISDLLGDNTLFSDAQTVSRLFSNDLIEADQNFDVVGGILSLLRLYRKDLSADTLKIALRCGAHLLAQLRDAEDGGLWRGQGARERADSGRSRGITNIAYALASLAAASGQEEFATAALKHIAYEDRSGGAERGHSLTVCKAEESGWHFGRRRTSLNVGLARAAIIKWGGLEIKTLISGVTQALDCIEVSWPAQVDTLCCGTLASIEFFHEAGAVLDQSYFRELAPLRMMAVVQDAMAKGDYSWDFGAREFNVGLFRGLAGVGYTLLRRVDASLPNVLIWD